MNENLIINYTKLKRLLNNDDQLTARYLIAFKEEVTTQLSVIRDSLKNNDWSRLSNCAHMLKSQIKYLGLPDLVDLAYVIEKDAENESNLDLMEVKVNDLDSRLSKMLKLNGI